MHIGIFGGTFDPPHLGHSAVVSECLRQRIFDEVWYLPAVVHDPQFAKPNMSLAQHRLAMLQLVQETHTQAGEKVRVETIEIDENLPGLTHRTLRTLAAKYPEHRLSFILGSDQLAKLHLWGCDLEKACFPAVFAEFEWYVYPRGGVPIGVLPFEQLKEITGVEPLEVSSTKVREQVSAGKLLAGLVDPKVEKYVLEWGLYRRGE